MTGSRPTQTASLTKDEIEQVVGDTVSDEADREIEAALTPGLLAAAVGGAGFIGTYLEREPTVTPSTPAVAAVRRKRVARHVGINETTRRRLRRKLRRAAAEHDVDALRVAAREGLRNVFSGAMLYRAPGISITEVAAYWGVGTFAQGLEFDVPARLWITQQDDRVRASHIPMQGQCRPYGQAFVSGAGNYIRYPGDGDAPISEIILCRCAEMPINTSCESRGKSFKQYWQAQLRARAPYERAVNRALVKVFRNQYWRGVDALERALRM